MARLKAGWLPRHATVTFLGLLSVLTCNLNLHCQLGVGRFKVFWGAGRMTREEIEGVGFEWCDCAQMMQVQILVHACGWLQLCQFFWIHFEVWMMCWYGITALQQGWAGRWFQLDGRYDTTKTGSSLFKTKQNLLIFRWRTRILCLKPCSWIVVHQIAIRSGTDWMWPIEKNFFFHQ